MRRDKQQFKITNFINPSGNTVFRVTGMKGTTRVRENYPTYDEALAARQRHEIETLNLHVAPRLKATRLTDQQICEAESAFSELGDRSLMDAVRYYLKNYQEASKEKTIKDAYNEFLSEKEREKLRPDSLKSLRQHLRPLVLAESTNLVSEVSVDRLRGIIDVPGGSGTYRNNIRRDLHTFFAWSKNKGFCGTNPVEGIRRVKVDR